MDKCKKLCCRKNGHERMVTSQVLGKTWISYKVRVLGFLQEIIQELDEGE